MFAQALYWLAFELFWYKPFFIGNIFCAIFEIFFNLKFTTMGSGKVLASVLAGAAAGAVLGILFAPDKGTETRRKIAEKGSDLAGNVKDKYNEYADVISDKY